MDQTLNQMGTDGPSSLGSKGMAIASGATLEIFGKYDGAPFTNLKASVNPNDNTIYVADEVFWNVGDEIVLVNTDFELIFRTYTESTQQNERRKISAIQKNLSCPNNQLEKCCKITLDSPLKYLHYAGSEYQGEVLHLTRNILFRGDDSSKQTLYGAQIIIRTKNKAHISGAAFQVFFILIYLLYKNNFFLL